MGIHLWKGIDLSFNRCKMNNWNKFLWRSFYPESLSAQNSIMGKITRAACERG